MPRSREREEEGLKVRPLTKSPPRLLRGVFIIIRLQRPTLWVSFPSKRNRR